VYIALVELNLRYSSGEKVRFGPYSFPDWEVRKSWERRFRQELKNLSREDHGLPYKITPEFLIGEPMTEDDVMEAPEPNEAARNVLILWDRGMVVPLTNP
jgi:hypothetical protein